MVVGWRLEALGSSLRVIAAHGERLKQLDDEWTPLRGPKDAHLHWRWSEIHSKGRETIALVDPGDQVMGLWTSMKPVVKLAEGNFYRLDYMEVHPSHLGKGFGKLMIAVACRQAQCHGCSGVLLGSLPDAAETYRGLGAEQRIAAGWQVAKGLVPFVFVGEAFNRLVEVCDGYVQKKR